MGEAVLSGLSNPRILGIDVRDRIYFSEVVETDEVSICTLERFNPITGRVRELVSHEDMVITLVGLDASFNIYYVARSYNENPLYEIYKLPVGKWGTNEDHRQYQVIVLILLVAVVLGVASRILEFLAIREEMRGAT